MTLFRTRHNLLIIFLKVHCFSNKVHSVVSGDLPVHGDDAVTVLRVIVGRDLRLVMA